MYDYVELNMADYGFYLFVNYEAYFNSRSF